MKGAKLLWTSTSGCPYNCAWQHSDRKAATARSGLPLKDNFRLSSLWNTVPWPILATVDVQQWKMAWFSFSIRLWHKGHRRRSSSILQRLQRLHMHTCSQRDPVFNWAFVYLRCLRMLLAWVMYGSHQSSIFRQVRAVRVIASNMAIQPA